MIRTTACGFCKHFNRVNEWPRTCSAFPDGIPFEVLTGGIPHDDPVDGDHGIQYEPLPKYADLRPARRAEAAQT